MLGIAVFSGMVHKPLSIIFAINLLLVIRIAMELTQAIMIWVQVLLHRLESRHTSNIYCIYHVLNIAIAPLRLITGKKQ